MNPANSNRIFNVALIPGDGIGQEVVPEGIRVLEALAARHGFEVKFEAFPFGCQYYLKHGVMMPADGLEQLGNFDAILLGAVGDRHVRHAPLAGVRIPTQAVPRAIDELPALMVAAACAEGVTELTGAAACSILAAIGTVGPEASYSTLSPSPPVRTTTSPECNPRRIRSPLP